MKANKMDAFDRAEKAATCSGAKPKKAISDWEIAFLGIGVLGSFYLISGFAAVSEDGIGNRSCWPGLGSGMMDGK